MRTLIPILLALPLLAACTHLKPELTPMTLNQKISHLLTQPAPKSWQPITLTKSRYLDLMEPILRTAATWQDERGAIIDPVDKKEHGQTSPRFIAPGAILLAAGRGAGIPEFREKILLGMDYSTASLATKQADSPDFWMRELMTARNALATLPDIPSARREKWDNNIKSVLPEEAYRFVSSDPDKIKTFHNWVIYAAAGEAMRSVANLAPPNDNPSLIWGQKFFEKYMPAQLDKFSDLGMYRDPGDPFTYDFTTRLQIMNAFAAGYHSPLEPKLDDLLQKGALAQLLYVSPNGYAPFGGRSAMMNLQEAILAAISELEARRYKISNPRLASAFKRMAHLHAESIARWITEVSPPRHIKNNFRAETRLGSDPYGKVSVYSLFAASCLGLAFQYADDSIPEAPAPAEIGGYVLTLAPAFHKVFATCQNTHIEIDTAADLHYDATGLGRFTSADAPLELALAMPMTTHPKYDLPDIWQPKEPTAIGPRWQNAAGQWTSLAALGGKNLSSTVTTELESPEKVIVSITWQTPEAKITQRYTLTKNHLAIEIEIPAAKQIALTLPLLTTDGQSTATHTLTQSSATVLYKNVTYRIQFNPAYTQTLAPEIANRNGAYKILTLSTPGTKIAATLTLPSSDD